MTIHGQRSMAAGVMDHGYAVFLVGAHGELDMNTFSSCSHFPRRRFRSTSLFSQLGTGISEQKKNRTRATARCPRSRRLWKSIQRPEARLTS